MGFVASKKQMLAVYSVQNSKIQDAERFQHEHNPMLYRQMQAKVDMPSRITTDRFST